MKKYFFLALGSFSFMLGTLGIFLPLLPTVPFYLLAGILFHNNSERFSSRLKENRFYKKVMLEYTSRETLTPLKAVKILSLLFVLLAISFFLTDLSLVRHLLVAVFLGHAVGFAYFFHKKRKKSI